MDSSLSLIAICCSLHMQGLNPNPQGYNQFNPGIGIEYEAPNFGAITGLWYHDSQGKAATVIGYSPYRGWARPFIGIADGYFIHGLGKIAPAAGLNIEPWHKSGPTFTITPMNLTGVVIGFAWKERVKGWIK